MNKLIVVRAPGLTADQAVRGDMAWNVSDLIADGSFAPFSTPPDLDGLAGDGVSVVDVAYRDAASFDAELGKVREGAAGAAIAILSEEVFISSHWFREIGAGATLAGADVPRLLSEIVKHPAR